MWADLFRIPYETPALTKDFRIDPTDYRRPNGGIVFPNPNAPTGICESVEFVEDIVKDNPDSIVIIDEAYIDLAGRLYFLLLISMIILWSQGHFQSPEQWLVSE